MPEIGVLTKTTTETNRQILDLEDEEIFASLHQSRSIGRLIVPTLIEASSPQLILAYWRWRDRAKAE